MSNLENLVQKILTDSNDKASVILDQAKKAKDEIIASREKEANDEKRKIIDRVTREAELAKERVVSGAELKVRNEKLMAKQEVIERTFKLAGEKLKSIDDDKYKSFLKDTLDKLSLKGSETIVVPKAMVDKLGDLKLNLSKDEFVESGFLIKDGGITLNYTFDSLMYHLRDELETQVALQLFKE